MCGILGAFVRRPIAAETVKQAVGRMRHRGPDDMRYVAVDGTGRRWLAATRLSIVDRTAASGQPSSTVDGRHWLVSNGEIYNHGALRRGHAAAGFRFRSRGDTEVLLAHLVRHGTAGLVDLVGMFALCHVDRRAGVGILARDPFGIKPLFYRATADGLAFASELPALLALTAAPRRVDRQRARDFLQYGLTDHGEGTLLEGINIVPPGSALVFDLEDAGTVRRHRYWHPERIDSLDIGFDEAATETRRLLVESVDLHCRADVEVAAAVSGGLDSSSLVLLADELRSARGPLPTFSYTARNPRHDESAMIRIVLSRGTFREHWFDVDPDEVLDLLDPLVRHQGEPIPSLAVVAQYLLHRAVHATGLRVLLEGQGADELLGGYPRARTVRTLELLRAGRTRAAARALRAAGGTTRLVWPELARAVGASPAGGAWLPRPGLPRCCPAAAWDGTTDLEASPVRDSLAEEARHQLQVNDLPMLLRLADRSSMAWSVESRVPFLTVPVASFLLALPPSYLVGDDGTSKRVLRAAMADRLPSEVIDQKDKVGFARVDPTWIRAAAPWFDRVLQRSDHGVAPLVDLDVLRADWRVATGLLDRGDDRVVSVVDGGFWRCVSFLAWALSVDAMA